jgi:gas vesicle protein
MSDKDNPVGTVLAAFAIGAIAGAAVALLFAPAAGAETRRKLAEKARAGRDRVSDLVDRGRDAFEQVRKETL